MGKITKKELRDLTIVDDFVFGVVMSNSKLCKPLLGMNLETKIIRIEYSELQNARYIDSQVKLMKKSNRVRKKLKLQNNQATIEKNTMHLQGFCRIM